MPRARGWSRDARCSQTKFLLLLGLRSSVGEVTDKKNQN